MGKLTENRDGIGVAVMGYGIVGKGVAHAIRVNAGLIEKRTGVVLRLKHILDILDFPESPDAALLTHDVSDIMRDEGVRVIVETMGGVNKAFEYTKEALASGKHVVTSNKELVAEYGPELLALAESRGVCYRFDASVGGGIPAIDPIGEYLAANKINEIRAILNGTTNFMLTHMRVQGAHFDDTLRLAQNNGFAEKNPEADIEGADACRKLAILSSIAWDAFLDWKTIHTEGIANVTLEDIIRASGLGRSLKLIARARRREDGRLEAYVLPTMINKRSPLANVEGVNNAIIINGDLAGDIMLYGQGAGMFPTGSAIVSDIIKIFKDTKTLYGDSQSQVNSNRAGGFAPSVKINPCWNRAAPLVTADFSTYEHGFYARIGTPAPNVYSDILFREFPDARILPVLDSTPNGAAAYRDNANGIDKVMLAFTLPPLTEGEFTARLARVNERVADSATCFVARLLDHNELF